MVDRDVLRRIIEETPPGDDAARVSREWLEEVARDLDELADRRSMEAIADEIFGAREGNQK